MSHACVRRTTYARSGRAREPYLPSLFLSLPSSAFALYSDPSPSFSQASYLPSSLSLAIDIRTARSNITIRSQTNSLAMPRRLPFTGRTVVSPVWPDLDCTWGAVTVGTHQTIPGSRAYRMENFTSSEERGTISHSTIGNIALFRLSNGIGMDRDIRRSARKCLFVLWSFLFRA